MQPFASVSSALILAARAPVAGTLAPTSAVTPASAIEPPASHTGVDQAEAVATWPAA